MNMWLYGYFEVVIVIKNIIVLFQFKEIDGSLKCFDCCVVNLFFFLKNWNIGIVLMEDEYNCFIGYGVLLDKNGDYVFLLYIIVFLKSIGKVVVIFLYGVLFWGNVEVIIWESIFK